MNIPIAIVFSTIVIEIKVWAASLGSCRVNVWIEIPEKPVQSGWW